MRATLLKPEALGELAAPLEAASLPIADLADPDRLFFQFEDHALAGYGGIEGAGRDRLLRSLIVVADRRGADDWESASRA